MQAYEASALHDTVFESVLFDFVKNCAFEAHLVRAVAAKPLTTTALRILASATALIQGDTTWTGLLDRIT